MTTTITRYYNPEFPELAPDGKDELAEAMIKDWRRQTKSRREVSFYTFRCESWATGRQDYVGTLVGRKARRENSWPILAELRGIIYSVPTTEGEGYIDAS